MAEKGTDWDLHRQDSQSEESSNAFEIDLFTLIPLLIKKLPRIILVGFVCAVLIIIWGFTLMPVSYQATEKLYVSGGGSSIVDLSDLQLGSTLSSDFKEVFFNKEIHEQVRQILRLDYTDEELEKMITVTNPTGRILTIRITSTKSEYEALRLVEEYSEAARLFIEERMGSRIPSIFEKASLLEFHRGLTVKTILAFVLGSLISALVIVAKYILGGRITERDYIEVCTEMPVLGVIARENKGHQTREIQKA